MMGWLAVLGTRGGVARRVRAQAVRPLALWRGRERGERSDATRCPHAPAQGQRPCGHARTGFARCAAPLARLGKGLSGATGEPWRAWPR